MAAWMIPAAMIGSALISKMGGGSSGKETTSKAPAPWEGDQKLFWDDFVNSFYGLPKPAGAAGGGSAGTGSATSDLSALFNASINKTALPEWSYGGSQDSRLRQDTVKNLIAGDGFYTLSPAQQKQLLPIRAQMLQDPGEHAPPGLLDAVRYSVSDPAAFASAFAGGPAAAGEEGDAPKSFKDMLGEDTEFQKSAFQEWLSAMSGNTTGYLDSLRGVKDTYLAPQTVRIGGKSMRFIPGGARRSADSLLDVMGKEFGMKEGEAKRKLSYGMEFTPNKADRDYLNVLMPLVMQMQGNRYGIPTTTQTGSLSPSMTSQLAQVLQLYNAGKDIFGSGGSTGGNTAADAGSFLGFLGAE
ncbi:MAG: hypothetical protein C4530_10000 [Desulfobacteraceae bacterium]|nr:MAG: hypothetical protein C4530_10000 [Desulfobacteraceae bacterium]